MAWKPDYVSGSTLRSFARGTADDDAWFSLLASSVSRSIDDSCRRQFGQEATAVERRYTAWYGSAWTMVIDDLMTTDDLVVSTADGTITEYDLEPVNAAADGEPWTMLRVRASSAVQPTRDLHGVTVVGRWGWLAVPAVVETAARLQGSRWAARRDTPYGVAGSPDMGSEIRLLAKLDPDVAVLLRSVRRPEWMATS